ncbi:MAG: hypothetical protein M3271_05625 [Actinomycetota bacterium]|nr:hypothetical protein [Actinomycetota bacterium]
MNGFDTPGSGGAPPVSEFEDVHVRVSGTSWVLVLLQLPLGAVALALAVSEDSASGKAAFSHDAWRVALGVVGGALALLALRAAFRFLADNVPTVTPKRQRQARVRGRILLVVGAWLFAAAVIEDVGESSVSFDSWTRPFFGAGGVYLMLMGLVFQLNPARSIRRARLAKGEGYHGTARILGANDTGVSVNEQPQVKIDFEIDVNGRVHRASDEIVMERAKLALLIPGSTVDVLVDRVDPSVFHVYWDSWKPPP